jgi:hypothetical protein
MDEHVIRQFALKKPVARVLVNTPAVFGSIGMTTNLFPALTLGSASSGHGITADNVSPMNLIYRRKVGYGVKNIRQPVINEVGDEATKEMLQDTDQLKMLHQLLLEALKQ